LSGSSAKNRSSELKARRLREKGGSISSKRRRIEKGIRREKGGE
jgi:hypothetical protein